MREAYRRGVRDCFESIERHLKKHDGQRVEAWLKELDAWDYDDPPPAPLLLR